MKIVCSFFIFLFVMTGCVMNTKNLTFDEKDNKKFRVTFACNIPFDDVRKVDTFEEKNTVKDVYFVEFANIYESSFDVTNTYLEDSGFSLEDYVLFIEEEGAHIYSQVKIDGILYITFKKRGKIFNQIVSATSNNINIVNAEPMMFSAIKKYCSKK